MTPEELAALKGMLTGFGSGALAAGAIAFLFVRHYMSAYLLEKGKNLATREDIEEITEKVEAIRAQHASLVEELKARHQLRLAAVDRRLHAHQEAFTLWRKLMAVVHSDQVIKVVQECQTWWEQNCVYLEPKVRGVRHCVSGCKWSQRSTAGPGRGLAYSVQLEANYELPFGSLSGDSVAGFVGTRGQRAWRKGGLSVISNPPVEARLIGMEGQLASARTLEPHHYLSHKGEAL